VSRKTELSENMDKLFLGNLQSLCYQLCSCLFRDALV